VDLYIHSLTNLHGVVLNQLSTGTTLTLPAKSRSNSNYKFMNNCNNILRKSDISNPRRTPTGELWLWRPLQRLGSAEGAGTAFAGTLGFPKLSRIRNSGLKPEYGTFATMRIGRGNRSTWRKRIPVPLCPPQIPHDLTWGRTRTAA
jgi:hypothetical protein